MLSKSEIKYIQSLSDKKLRDQENVFIVEGVKMADEIITNSSSLIKVIYATEKWIVKNGNKISKGILIHQLKADELQRLSQLTVANEVIILLRKPDFPHFNPENHPLVVALDHIQDPGNLGTIIRTCDWFGVDYIICSPDSADAFNTKVVQAAMGSLMRVQVRYQDINLFLSEFGMYTSCVAVLDGQPINDVTFPEKTVVIFGNESKGVSAGVQSDADIRFTIPRKGQAESLNVAVAAAIVLSKINT